MFTLQYAPPVAAVLTAFILAAYTAVPIASGPYPPPGALTRRIKNRGFTLLSGGATLSVISSLLAPATGSLTVALIGMAGVLLFAVVILVCTALTVSGLYRRADRSRRARQPVNQGAHP